ncbi:hypothetical protein [Legionella maioricensis]|uniref:Uncharacterized protein n=1 Tax=Legionella maioricensis TaxID=2896528 RepID=A0A9X2D3S3_9GAMM|nr:hypothetical protein [Legionella maioricensis]MCL9685728.1 hypothetical protein [Legionella maioricensis]MCL9688984.1 hypothetical protein [Legionella maioricensis]
MVLTPQFDYLFMAEHYGIALSASQKQLFILWIYHGKKQWALQAAYIEGYENTYYAMVK